jgi:preprotein translocase subunit SecA
MFSSEAGIPRWLIPPPVLLPQRGDRKVRWLDRIETFVAGVPILALPRLRRVRLSRIIAMTNARETALRIATDQDLATEARELRRLLSLHGLHIDLVARSFALIRELAGRAVGLRHFDVQLLGGYVLLKGMLAEMETGEGKTLTATLAAGTAALAGIPVHIVTVNDYLAARDAKAMSPIYRALGLTVGTFFTESQRRSGAAPTPVISPTPPTRRSPLTICAIVLHWAISQKICDSSSSNCTVMRLGWPE